MTFLIKHANKIQLDAIMPLRYFNYMHILMCVLPVVLFFILFFALKNKTEKAKESVLFYISIGNIILFIIYKIAIALVYKPFFIMEHLPLQLCNINLILIPIALKTRNKYICNYLYYMGIWGAYCGVLFFDTYFLGKSSLSFIVLAYFIYHSVISVTCLYIAVGKLFVPSKDMIWKSLVLLFAFGVAMLCLNLFLRHSGICPEANYFYTMGMRGNPVLGRLMKFIKLPLLYAVPLSPIIYLFDYVLYLPFKNKAVA